MSKTSGYVTPKWLTRLRRKARRSINVWGIDLRVSIFVALHGDTPLYAGLSLDKVQAQAAAFQRALPTVDWPREQGPAVDEHGWHQGPGNPWVRGHWMIYKMTIFSCPWPALLMLAAAYGIGVTCAIIAIFD